MILYWSFSNLFHMPMLSQMARIYSFYDRIINVFVYVHVCTQTHMYIHTGHLILSHFLLFFTDVMCVSVLSHVPLFMHPMNHSPPGSSVHGIFQARIEYWSGLPFPPAGDLHDPGIEPTYFSCISCIGRQILYHCASWGATDTASLYKLKGCVSALHQSNLSAPLFPQYLCILCP